MSAVPNGAPNTADHGRKPSVVINASGATGYTPNGGPVSVNARPAINFGSMNSQGSPLPNASLPHQSQNASLATPHGNPRVISPSHSPSPIPHQPPLSSGGRLTLSGSQPSQNNGVTFGSLGGDAEQVGPYRTILLDDLIANPVCSPVKSKCHRANWAPASPCMSDDNLRSPCKATRAR